jgi:hypothetical protein
MKNVIYSALLATFLFSCGNNEGPQKASTDLITNPATADSSKESTANPSQVAVITFEKASHDFGTITQGEQAEYSFKFQNSGGQDLLISSATASCGCTVPEYSKEPIKPGGVGYIKVKFNSDYRLDAFEKSITITANTRPLESLLIIKGFINPKPDAQTEAPIH